MRFRVGRHNPQLVYSMLDDEPSDRDALLATCFTPGSASEIVKALNQAVGGSTPGQPDDMYEQAYHGVQKALDYAIGTHEESGAGAGIVADAMLLAQRYVDLRAAVLAGEAGFRTVERLEDPERAEALLIRYERAVEALRPAEGSTPEDQLIDEVIADAGPREPLDDCPKPDPHGPHIVTLDAQAGVVQRCPGLRPPPEEVVSGRCPACGSPEPDLHPNTPSAQYDDGPALHCLNPFHGRAGEVVSVPPPADELVEPMYGRVTESDLAMVAWATGGGFRSQDIQLPLEDDEPAPVSPPVDALLALLDEWLEHDVNDHTAAEWTARRDSIYAAARALWAAGVTEGRQQLDEVQKLAALHGYELGVAAGLRQATEERTEEKITPATAHLMPRPRGYVCAAGCGHADLSHREHGCDVPPCECPAPFGRILPSAEAADHG